VILSYNLTCLELKEYFYFFLKSVNTILQSFSFFYLKPGYEKDMDMAKLYFQYKVEDCRGEDTSKYQKEIDNAFEKLDKRYTDHAINK
jgi:hypothetical protein